MPTRRRARSSHVLGVDVHRPDQGAGPAGAGPERHAVQPQRRERHLPRPEEAPRAGRNGLELRRARRVHVPAGGVRGLRRHEALGRQDGPLLPQPALARLDGPLAPRPEGRARTCLHLLPRLGEVPRARRGRRAVRRQCQVPGARTLTTFTLSGSDALAGASGRAGLGHLPQPQRREPRRRTRRRRTSPVPTRPPAVATCHRRRSQASSRRSAHRRSRRRSRSSASRRRTCRSPTATART